MPGSLYAWVNITSTLVSCRGDNNDCGTGPQTFIYLYYYNSHGNIVNSYTIDDGSTGNGGNYNTFSEKIQFPNGIASGSYAIVMVAGGTAIACTGECDGYQTGTISEGGYGIVAFNGTLSVTSNGSGATLP